MLEMIKSTGWPIWPLLVASVIALALILERLVSLRRKKVLPDGLLDLVINDIEKNNLSGEFIQKLEHHSPLGRVLATGIKARNLSRDRMKESIEETGRLVAHELERYLTSLGTLASISPLLGLFGTVVGVIEIFAAQGLGGANPEQLAQGISIALNTTGMGLLIAIPAMIFWRHFRALVDSFLIDMEQQAIRLVDKLNAHQEDKSLGQSL